LEGLPKNNKISVNIKVWKIGCRDVKINQHSHKRESHKLFKRKRLRSLKMFKRKRLRSLKMFKRKRLRSLKMFKKKRYIYNWVIPICYYTISQHLSSTPTPMIWLNKILNRFPFKMNSILIKNLLINALIKLIKKLSPKIIRNYNNWMNDYYYPSLLFYNYINLIIIICNKLLKNTTKILKNSQVYYRILIFK
jgi:hypothetical protein